MSQHITSHAQLLKAAETLAARDHDMGRALERIKERLAGDGLKDEWGPLPDRSKPPGFAALLFLIAAQQVSTASARAIQGRIEAAVPQLTPEIWLSLSPQVIDTLGLSRPKKRYAQVLAQALIDGSLDLEGLGTMSLDEASAHLCALKGIGPWTAHVYMLFSHGSADAFPAGDIALQGAAQHLLGLEARPPQKELEDIALAWAPMRGVAAHILWAYYKTI